MKRKKNMASNTGNDDTRILLSVALPLMISTAVILSLSLPHLFSSDLPHLWSSLRSWLRPPYLYFILNGIIITIAATSRRNHHNNPTAEDADHLHHHYATSSEINLSDKAADPMPAPADHDAFMFHNYGPLLAKDVDVVDETSIFGGSLLFGEEVTVMMKAVADDREAESTKAMDRERAVGFYIDGKGERNTCSTTTPTRDPETTWIPPIRQDSVESPSEDSPYATEKPSALSRFAHCRRASRAATSEGGRALRVAKPKRQETLEATWKTITEGRPMPLKRHLKKSDSQEINRSRLQDNSADDAPSPSSRMGKNSVSFNDGCSPSTREYSALPAVPPRRLRKEPSLSQDELNRRVEAFIKKVNAEMRLQRQESLQRFKEMIDRGA